MPRVVTVWCPDWPVAAAGMDPQVPAIVVHANRVVARSRAAAEVGVEVGQKRRSAQGLCPEALVLDHDPDRDVRAAEPLVEAVSRFVPRLEVVEAGWLTFEARGPSRYFGGEAAFTTRLLDEVAGVVSVRPQVGIADGRFASSVAARRAVEGPLLVPPSEAGRFLAPLPVEWLQEAGEVDVGLVDTFCQMGLHRLGDVAALPLGHVLARFGPSGRLAHLLASGADDDPLLVTEPHQPLLEERRLDAPVEQMEPVAFTVKQLADRLTERLAADGQVCTKLLMSAETDHAETSERAWYRAAGLTATAMVERARWQIGSWIDTGAPTAGIVLVRLVAIEVRAADGEPVHLWGDASDLDRRAARAAARLVGVVGEDAVLVPEWHGGQLPAQRWRWVPAALLDLTDLSTAGRRMAPGAGEGPWSGTIPPPAPLWTPVTLEPADLRDGRGEAVLVDGRGELTSRPATLAVARGPAEQVEAWAGPWPLHASWWDPNRRRRAARLQVVTDRGHAHVLLAERRSWSVVGTYT